MVCERTSHIHSVTVHALTHQDIVVVVVGGDLLHSNGSVLLELINSLLGGAAALEMLQDLLEVD